MKQYIIYIHRNKINGKVYIGQTSETLSRRARGGCGYAGSPHFYRAIQEYGWKNFEHLTLEENLTSEQADEREKYWIKVFDATNPNKGYNLTVGGKKTETSGISKNRKRVVCKETGQVFDSLTQAAIWAGMSKNSTSNITAQINGKKPSAGKHPVTGEHLHWYFEGQQDKVKEKIKQIPGAKKVKNLDTNEIFDSMSQAARKYGITVTTITNSCKTNGAVATGTLKEKWHWVFLED